MLPAGAAAGIATRAVAEHQGDRDVFAVLTGFVAEVQRAAGSGSGAVAGAGPSQADGAAVSYVSAGLAPAYWGGFGGGGFS
jgi:hypothetical protein